MQTIGVISNLNRADDQLMRSDRIVVLEHVRRQRWGMATVVSPLPGAVAVDRSAGVAVVVVSANCPEPKLVEALAKVPDPVTLVVMTAEPTPKQAEAILACGAEWLLAGAGERWLVRAWNEVAGQGLVLEHLAR